MKGKLFLTGLLAFAAGVFVSKNKWCQDKIQKAEEILGKKKQNEEPAVEEEKPGE